ncbi:uncharacterized protein LOC110685686 [Chenopodium quinoa]|uniref:uncharacterized protein LOC110685686 n=1 Tax=Chenopodium quinoa TaxID=63459 RepID=UPI000B781CDB|nr:uncharacterized protein LOC110685686 [Chenopodium quinoa]
MSITLDHEEAQYATWVELFQIQACAFNVLDHIDTTVSHPTEIDDATWKRLDAIVKQWIYGTISKDLVHIIMKLSATAQELWTWLEELFHDNKHTRAVYLEEQFTNTKLEHYANMFDYCKQIKFLADQLANVDCSVSNQKMVMQLIAGITKGKYDTVAANISQTKPTPSFNKARSIFLLEETRQKKQKESSQHVLVAQSSQTQSISAVSQPNHQQAAADQRDGGANRGRGRGDGINSKPKGRGKGRGNNNSQQQHQQSGPRWQAQNQQAPQ